MKYKNICHPCIYFLLCICVSFVFASDHYNINKYTKDNHKKQNTVFSGKILPKLIFPSFNSVPSENGWTFIGNDIEMYDIKDGILVQNSIGRGNVKGHFDIPKGTIINPNSTWLIKTVLRIFEIEDPDHNSGFFFNVVQNNYCYSVRIQPSKVLICNQKHDEYSIIHLDNTILNEYILIGGPEPNWQLYINDVFVTQGVPFSEDSLPYNLSYEIAFGDGSSNSGANAHGEWASFSFTQEATGVEESPEVHLPEEYPVFSVYPNPFNASLNIYFELPYREHVSCQVYNAIGEKIDYFEFGEIERGIYQHEWDASHVSSGVYFVRIKIGTYIKTERCILTK